MAPFIARHPSSAIVLALALSVAACGSPSRPSLLVTRTDSAGVQIVTTETSAADVPVYAMLDSAPRLKLGSLEGRPEEQFSSIPTIAGVAPLSDGSVAVLDALAAEIRIFGPDGAYLRTVGRKGKGPGELSMPRALVALPGDTLIVYDWLAGRITRFNPDGQFGRDATLRSSIQGRPYVTSFFDDGSMAGQVQLARPLSDTGDESTFRLDSAVLTLSGTDGALLDTIGVFPGFEAVKRTTSRDRDGGFSVSFVPAAFARSLVFAAVPNGVWVGFSDHYTLRLLDRADGRVKRILRTPGLQRPLTDVEAKAILDSALAGAEKPEQQQTMQDWYEVSPRPNLRPAYDRLIVDNQGHLWLRDWPGANTDSELWWVFDHDGTLLGSARAPKGMSLISVRDDQAWGLLRDDLDVQYVVCHRLHAAGT